MLFSQKSSIVEGLALPERRIQVAKRVLQEALRIPKQLDLYLGPPVRNGDVPNGPSQRCGTKTF